MVDLEWARDIFRVLTPVFKDHGYLLAMYGSVLSAGQGRDLDLIAVPWLPNATTPDQLMEIIRKDAPPSYHQQPKYVGAMLGTESHGAYFKGVDLDIQFRLQSARGENL